MADQLKPNPHSLILFLTFSLLISSPMAEVSLANLEAAIFALQLRGFNLFGNSIAVSDLSVQILSHSFNSTSTSTSTAVGRRGFTFLAPPNSALFSLDMSTDAFTYVHSLRFHVVPRRLSFSELRNISHSSNPYIETLVPGHVLFVASSGGRRRRVVSIDGVRVSFPDLYLTSDIAIHGLDGILVSSNEDFLHRLDPVTSPSPTFSPSPAPITGSGGFQSVSAPTFGAFSPQIVGFPAFSPQVERVQEPPEAFSPDIEGIMPFTPQFEGIPAPIQYFPPQIEVPPHSSEFAGLPAFSPEFDGIPEVKSPIGAFSPEFGEIPAFHDVTFTDGSFNSISIPPTDAYSPESDEIPAPSPSMEFFSPNEYSISPEQAEWSHSEFLSPNFWSLIWSIPPPYTVGEWPEN